MGSLKGVTLLVFQHKGRIHRFRKICSQNLTLKAVHFSETVLDILPLAAHTYYIGILTL